MKWRPVKIIANDISLTSALSNAHTHTHTHATITEPLWAINQAGLNVFPHTALLFQPTVAFFLHYFCGYCHKIIHVVNAGQNTQPVFEIY